MPVSNEWLDQNAGNFPRETQHGIAEELKALRRDCRTLCNALQHIEAGESEPRMIARRALETPSVLALDGKAALRTANPCTCEVLNCYVDPECLAHSAEAPHDK